MERFVDLLHHQARKVRGIGFEANASGERDQYLARVVLLAEEVSIEPRARAISVEQPHGHERQQREVSAGPARGDFAKREIAVSHQHPRQGH